MIDLSLAVGDADLAAMASGQPPALILLHPGVGDRRCWRDLMLTLAPMYSALAIDMRGFGGSPPAAAPFSPTADLDAVVRACTDGPITLVGNSLGGAVAIDYALAHPERVDRLVLIAPNVSGAPEPDWDAELGHERVARVEAAEAAGDLNALNRLEAFIWLDGPGGPEGRVGGAARELFLQMNGVALEHMDAPGPSDPPSAQDRLEELAMPVLVIVGTLDLAYQRERSASVARRVQHGRLVELAGVAHLPQLEDPAAVATAIMRFLAPRT